MLTLRSIMLAMLVAASKVMDTITVPGLQGAVLPQPSAAASQATAPRRSSR